MSETITGLATNSGLSDREGNVYHLRQRTVDDVTGSPGAYPSNEWGTERPRERFRDSSNSLSIKPLERDIKNQLHDAFYKITDSLDLDLSPSERSNTFDEWNDLLQALSLRGQDLSGNHRKILGALIASVGNKDISDFNKQRLLVLQEATNVLRQPSVTKSESKKVISILIKNDFTPTLNLSADNLTDESIKELEEMRAALLGIRE
jgi:hypothetical protein